MPDKLKMLEVCTGDQKQLLLEQEIRSPQDEHQEE
jgi:hypothetical protein